MIPTITQHHLEALTNLHRDHPYAKNPVCGQIVEVEGRPVISSSYHFSDSDVTLCSLSSATNLPLKPGRKKPDIITKGWWTKFKKLSALAQELYSIEEIKKFKRSEAKLIDWLEEQLKHTTAVHASNVPVVRLLGDKHAQHWLEDLYINFVSYPEWIVPDDRELLEEMTQFASLVDQKLTSSSLKCLSEKAPGCFAAFADTDSLEQWQKSRTHLYTLQQLRILKNRIKRLFSYSKLSFPKNLEAPVTYPRPSGMDSMQVRSLTEHEQAFFKALSLSPKQWDVQAPVKAESPT